MDKLPAQVPPADNLEKQLAAGAAVATLLTCVSAPFSSTFKAFGWALLVISAVLLFIIAAIRLNVGITNRRQLLVPIVIGMFVISLSAVGLAGWTLLHAPTSQVIQQPVAPASRQQQPSGAEPQTPTAPSISYTNTTSGPGSPITNGNGNTVNGNGQVNKVPSDKSR